MTTNRRVRPLPRLVIASAVLGLSTAAPLAAIWEVADGELFLSLDAAISADSNISSSSAELSDTIYSVTPGFTWERARGLGTISLGAECEIERASEYEQYDSENYSANFALSMPASSAQRLRGSINASYFDGSRVNAFENTRVSETSYSVGFDAAYQATGKINTRLGVDYSKTEPEQLAEYERNAINVGLGYNFRPDVSAFLDVRFTDSSSNPFGERLSTDTSGNAVLIGLDGQITPKISGSIGFGYDWSETNSGGEQRDYSGPSYDVSLTWSPRERTTIGLEAANGIQSTGTGGTEFFNVGLTVNQEIGFNMSANAGLSVRSSDFADENRGEDDVVQATLGGRYSMTRNISFGVSYTYTDSDSSLPLTNYSRSVWRFFGTARF